MLHHTAFPTGRRAAARRGEAFYSFDLPAFQGSPSAPCGAPRRRAACRNFPSANVRDDSSIRTLRNVRTARTVGVVGHQQHHVAPAKRTFFHLYKDRVIFERRRRLIADLIQIGGEGPRTGEEIILKPLHLGQGNFRFGLLCSSTYWGNTMAAVAARMDTIATATMSSVCVKA
jgi:hypothetical protein